MFILSGLAAAMIAWTQLCGANQVGELSPGYYAPLPGPGPETKQLRFVQDDAQDYMVSKIYVLKYVQSNDINPFVSSIVKRYNMNSIVNCIEYGNQNEQILTVTCPVGMMPYVDDFIAKVDRPIKVDGRTPGDIIKGTGITRAVYQPQYRSGQILVNLVVNAFINAGPYGSVYGYDANSNQIYWKDNTTNTQFMYQFLAFLDRPAPQIALTFTLYETRDSNLTDLGIDYLAWKNGPGLNLFQVAYQAFSLSSGGAAAINGATGGLGGIFFAPQFDASFIRILAQSGNAQIRNTANLTVANSDSAIYEIYFNPQIQNIIKSENDQASVTVSGIASLDGFNQILLQVVSPIANLHSGPQIDFSIDNYTPGMYGGVDGTLFFGYNIMTANAVERNNYGSELIATNVIGGNSTIALNREVLLAGWDKTEKVEQLIGMPFLSRIPYLKYLFSTTTTTLEKTKVFLTVKAQILNTAVQSEEAGKLYKLK
ncbi:MAG: hypothetical protein PHS41_10140 [Victivallaceae bacterium]|nr:hypothetical protein [Victivallaceae bacterium]